MALSRSSVSVGSVLLRRIGAPLAVAAMAAAIVAPSIANAGTLQVRDEAMLLSPSDRASLQSSVAMYPFDVRILTTNAFSDRMSFDRYVGAQVGSPNVVVVAVAPAIRRTSVHFGTGTRIGPQNWRAIEDAGDPFFRSGQWGMGISAIVGRASTFVGTGPAYMPAQNQYNYGGTVPPSQYRPTGYRVSTTRERSGFPIGTVLCLGIGAVMIFGLFALARRAARGATGGYDGGYRSPGQPGPFGGPGGPGYNPGYGPGYGAPGGVSPVTAGIAGAAVGGLAGYAIGRAVDDHGHTETYTTTTYDPPPSYSSGDSYGGSSYDAGGSSSGWDSGGGDSGGGGFDGGGGGDW